MDKPPTLKQPADKPTSHLYRTLARVLVQLEETGYTQKQERQATVYQHDHLPCPRQ
ncbi:MAG: hypothetical protein L0154_13630 [Chloroflexi bacterium]|nr:hypothetical protein [Chloroflexota bacterium]